MVFHREPFLGWTRNWTHFARNGHTHRIKTCSGRSNSTRRPSTAKRIPSSIRSPVENRKTSPSHPDALGIHVLGRGGGDLTGIMVFFGGGAPAGLQKDEGVG